MKKHSPPLILAIDTSCDDTAAAVTSGVEVWSNVIASQTELHKPYGGVFPTVAKQAHRENIKPVVELALKRARVSWDQLGGIAVTQGPGLAPALEVGIAYAKVCAETHNLPLYPINHIEGHLLSPLARPKPRAQKSSGSVKTTSSVEVGVQTEKTALSPQAFPTLGVVVSGGHTQFILVSGFGTYSILGQTLDDAAGECLDKVGRMLNLGYPAGAVIEQFAKKGDHTAIEFPLPMTTSGDYNLSFSGLKTFARNLLETQTASGTKPLSKQQLYDWCASVQYAVFRHICYKMSKIIEDAATDRLAGVVLGGDATKKNDTGHEVSTAPIVFCEVWLGGGVAVNSTLRSMIRETLRNSKTNSATDGDTKPLQLRVPRSKRYCCDNAAMIGVVVGLRGKNLKSNPNFERVPRLGV